jgi:DNA-directed RNA polymerase specialized sigma24 family protein
VNHFRNIDWPRVYKVLLVKAANIVRHYRGSDTFDGGFDYEDIVGQVCKEFFDSPDGLGWKESKGKIETYLGRVVHNKVVDHLRRQKHVAGSLDDDSRTVVLAQKSNTATAAPERARIDLKSELYALVGDDAGLKDLIAAAELTTGSHNVNQALGEILNKTPRQVSKLKERLLEKKGVKELYAARQAAKSRT